MDKNQSLMFPLSKCLAVIAATIIATSQSLHYASYFPEEICTQRSNVDLLYSLPAASHPSTSELHLSIVTELDRVIQETYDSLRMTETDILQRRAVLLSLQHDFSGRNLSLEAFGSCCNCFGTVASDLDVKITGNITPSEVVQVLSKEFTLMHVANRQPVIALQHQSTGVKVDASVNPINRPKVGLAIWLLRKYSRFDARVQVLGVFLKAVVNRLKISETRFGDLSSSAYITMLIHYLQQTNPPVLPGITKNKDANFVARNNATVAQLWLGFLRYYVHEFNYQENVICLYQVRCKTRKEKGWNGPDHNMISVESTGFEEKDDGVLFSPIIPSCLLFKVSDYILRVFNQLQTFYLKDNYDNLLRRNDINLDYHPRYGHKRHLLVDTWGNLNRTTCEVRGVGMDS